MSASLNLYTEMDSSGPASTDRKTITQEIERLRRSNFRSLNFSSDLEKQFELDSAKERSHRLWVEGLIAIVVFNGCLSADYLLVRDLTLATAIKRTELITPLALLVNYMMRRNPPRWIREGSVALGTTLICFINLYAQGGATAATATFGLMSVLITAVFANVVMRIRLPYMATSTAVMLTGGLWFEQHASGLIGSEKIVGTSMMTLGVIVTLIAGYSLERQERLSYLLFLRSELQGEELHRLSNLDNLTGLPNRRAFEDYFEKLWLEGARGKAPLSVIVVDIDHFKAVNDMHGHLYGDDVLRRVAGLLPKALRVQEDLAARFGGEEFVILLPNTNSESALLVAERVRKFVEMAGTPASEHLSGKPAVLATVSCGVSTYQPDGRLKRDRLLKVADGALYKAKAGGRNRVAFEICEPTSAIRIKTKSSSTIRWVTG